MPISDFHPQCHHLTFSSSMSPFSLIFELHLSYIWVTFELHLRYISATFQLHLSYIWDIFQFHLNYMSVLSELHFSFIYCSYCRIPALFELFNSFLPSIILNEDSSYTHKNASTPESRESAEMKKVSDAPPRFLETGERQLSVEQSLNRRCNIWEDPRVSLLE